MSPEENMEPGTQGKGSTVIALGPIVAHLPCYRTALALSYLAASLTEQVFIVHTLCY